MNKEKLSELNEMQDTIENLERLINQDECCNFPERHFFSLTADASTGGNFGSKVYDRINKRVHNVFIEALKDELSQVTNQFNSL